MDENNFITILNSENPEADHYSYPELSPSTRDHFRLLAKVKGDPWKTFFENIDFIPGRTRIQDIFFYVEDITKYWENFQHRILPYRWFTLKDYRILSSLENLPKQMMRKILGRMRKLPCPDTFTQVKEKFYQLEGAWAEELTNLFLPFFEIDEKYLAIIDEVYNKKESNTQVRPYKEQVCDLFRELPVEEILKIVKNLLR